MADDLHLNVVTDSDARGLKEAERELAATEKQAGKLGDSFEAAGKDSDKLEASLHEQAAEIKKLQAEYARTKKSVSDLTVEWLDADRENDQIVRRELRRERSRLSELQRAAKEFEGSFNIRFSHDLSQFTELGAQAGVAMADGAGKTFLSSLQGGLSTPGLGPALVGAIGGLITAAGPGLGALIGGTLTGALGTGAMAAGILSAAKDPAVKSAAKQFGEEISDEFFTGTAFVKPILASLDILKQGFRDLGINALLAPLAPTVITIAHGIADFVNNLKDNGLQATFQRMDQFAHIAAEGIASAGDALGFFFDEVSKDKGAMDGLRAFFAILNGTVRITALGINALEKIFHAFNITVAAVATAANKISFGHLDKFQHAAESILGVAPKVSGQLVYMSNSAHEVNKRLKEEATALQILQTELDAARAAVNRFMGDQLNMDEANLAVKRGILDLKEALAVNRGAWDDNTAAGQAHRQAVLDHLSALERQREAMAKATGDWAAADVQYLKGLEDLKKIAIQSGITGAALEAMMRDYRLRILADVVINAAPALGNWLADAFSKFTGKKRARGGPVVAGEAYVVGEERPELFVPSQNGTIFPSVGGGGGASAMGSSGARPLVINLPPDASYDEHRLIERIRTAVAARGGTLAVLGLRA